MDLEAHFGYRLSQYVEDIASRPDLAGQDLLIYRDGGDLVEIVCGQDMDVRDLLEEPAVRNGGVPYVCMPIEETSRHIRPHVRFYLPHAEQKFEMDL